MHASYNRVFWNHKKKKNFLIAFQNSLEPGPEENFVYWFSHSGPVASRLPLIFPAFEDNRQCFLHLPQHIWDLLQGMGLSQSVVSGLVIEENMDYVWL